MSGSLAKVAVVIPYFQRKAGLLLKAASSVLSQQTDAKIQLIVIDDSSPIPAQSELEELPIDWKDRVCVKRIPNGGVSHARNVGLDSVSEGTTFVAFLDSDDAWRPGHVARALQALQNKEDDFYFADFERHDWETTAFDRCPTFHPKEHSFLEVGPDLRRFSGDFFNQILRNNPIGTSTVVYRFERFRSLRFDEGLTISGEDILFWLDIVYKNERVVFSNQIEADYGAGVNICYDAKWGTEAGIKVSFNDILMLGITLRRFPLTEEVVGQIEGQREVQSKVLVEQTLHCLMRFRMFGLRWLAKFFIQDTWLCIRSVVGVFRSRTARALSLQGSAGKNSSD